MLPIRPGRLWVPPTLL